MDREPVSVAPIAMESGCRPGFRWICALGAAVLAACVEPHSQTVALRQGLALSGRLRPGETREFNFDLRRGQYVELEATQASVDLVLTLVAPSGERLPALDTQTTELLPERLTFVSNADGRYRLEVRGSGEQGQGPFRLEAREARPATDRDRKVAAGQERLNRAEALRREKKEASDLAALPLYAEAARLYRQAGDEGGESYVQLQWGRVLRGRDRNEEAFLRLRRCLAAPAGKQPPGLRARALTLMVGVSDDLGDWKGADRAGREALALWRQLGRATFQAEVLNSLALRASARAELTQAEAWYQEALRLLESTGDFTQQALVLSNLSSLYNLSGEPRLALDFAERAWVRLSDRATPAERSAVLEQKAEAQYGLGRWREAEETLLGALALLPESEALGRARLEKRLARHVYEAGRFAEAAERFRKALAVYERRQDRPGALAIRQDLAWAELKQGHLDAAGSLLDQAGLEAQSTGNLWVLAASLAGRARLEQRRGKLEVALSRIREALAIVEAQRGEVGRTDLTSSVFAGQQTYFDLAADLLLELYGETGARSLLEEAFMVSERSRARRLLDLLSAGPRTAASSEQDEGARAAEVALLRAEEDLDSLRDAKESKSEMEAGEKAVREAILGLRRLAGKVEKAVPELGSRPLSLAQIQRWIAPDMVLLEFDLGEDASYLWLLSRRELRFHRLPPRREVELRAREALEVLSSPGTLVESIRGHEVLLRVARLLLGEAASELAARRWLLVLDGALQALPLGALPNPESPHEPILLAHEIALAPSATVAVRLAERDRNRGSEGRTGELAVFADAAYQPQGRKEEPANSLPVAEGEAPSPERSARDGHRLDLPRLRFSGEEAERVLAMVRPEARLDARRFDATKARILAGQLEGFRRLHFAVHGLPNEEHAELSALALASYDRAGRRIDGVLHAYEIARLRLPADLVVLSSCRTAEGQFISGEGLVGMAHSFFGAGAARVVVSDWAVDDEATAALMSAFYDGLLRRNLRPTEALREAQLKIAGQGGWKRPYFWAAFVVQGGF